MTDEVLSPISVDQRLGHFCAPGLGNSAELGTVHLHTEERQMFWGEKYNPNQQGEPVCKSDDGVKSVYEFRPGGFKRSAIWDDCATCPQNEKREKNKQYQCHKAWALVIVCDDLKVRRLVLNSASQSALEQYLNRLRALINTIKQNERVELRTCDFAFTMRLEKRKGMYVYSLAYPIGMNDQIFQRIPFVDGKSKFNALYERYHHEKQPVSVQESVNTEVLVSMEEQQEITL